MILSAKNLHKTYKSGQKKVTAVNGVSLEVRKERMTAIIGPSGAGKSTLLHILGGLDRPTSGKVFLEETDIYKISDRERADIRNARIGFVFQFYHLLPEFTALENVMLPVLMRGRVAGAGAQEVKDRAREVLKLVGLESRIAHKPSELSGGESQRVAIARAIINGPEVLLCDEPTGNLDSRNSEAIYELLFGLKTGSRMALVVVTHDEKIAGKADEVIHIRDGMVA